MNQSELEGKIYVAGAKGEKPRTGNRPESSAGKMFARVCKRGITCNLAKGGKSTYVHVFSRQSFGYVIDSLQIQH